MSEWISVKDRMPEDFLEPGNKKRKIKVLVCRGRNRGSIRTESRTRIGNEWTWSSDSAQWGHLTHWMPLPDVPPKEVQKNETNQCG